MKGRIVQPLSGEPYDVFIGRDAPWLGLAETIWANPYKVGPEGRTHKQAQDEYRAYVQSKLSLMSRIHELHGATLACCCPPELCHGEVLLELAEAAAQTHG